MKSNIEGIIRYIAAYGKDDDSRIEIKYNLSEIDIDVLRNIFDVNANDADPGIKDMIDCYRISDEQASLLQPYIKLGPLNTKKYDLYLECCQDPKANWDELSQKYGYYPPPCELQAFPEAIPIKPDNTHEDR
jgi:hypothetical protein